jgi:serine/threonine protein kinase
MSGGHRVEAGETAIGTCATCGRPLTQTGPKGMCPSCLISLGFLGGSQNPGQSQTKRRLAPGPLKYDHFEVEVDTDGFPTELGAGAMAITYRARDTVLNSVVALKVIERSAAQNQGARSRFLREARAAARIRHPNVARVSYYGEQNSECFYVMELVEGETLDAWVRRNGPMPLALALEVIEQISRALAATEACGIVHRDIKPSNVMVEPDVGGALVVKVIDYGLAKVLSPEAERDVDGTHSGFIGTPAFASPEQSTNIGKTPVDTRSDIYSLGVTFWYLLSGRVPFVGRTLEDVRTRQTERLPLEQLKAFSIPPQCLSLLKWMLASDPADRPESAVELLSVVHRCSKKFSTEARSRRRRFVWATFIVAAIALGAWLFQSVRFSAASERSIAVLPFANLSPNGEDTYLTVGLQNEIADNLAHLADLKLVGTQNTRSYAPAKERNLRAIGRDLGVRYLLEGDVRRLSDKMRVSLRLIDIYDGSHRWTETYERSMGDMFALQSEITRSVAAHLRSEIAPNETVRLDTPPASDLQAYELSNQAHTLATTLSGGLAVGTGIGPLTYGDFRLSPLWDPLRCDTRFEADVQRLAPAASH